MKLMPLVGLATTMTLSLGVMEVAQAATVTFNTVGTWDDTLPTNVFNLTGEGTNTIRWGDPVTNSGRSGYRFMGLNNIVAPLDRTSFLLGNFTHFNNPISGNPPGSAAASITQTTLTLALTGDISGAIDFVFGHNETPNSGPDPRDIVQVLTASPQTSVFFGDKEYKLKISGFSQDGGITIVDQFFTNENATNIAGLYGRLVEVPTPAMLPGLIGMGVAALRKGREEANEEAEA